MGFFVNETPTSPKRTEPSFLKWLVWFLAAMFFFYEYFLRVSPSVATSELMASFHVKAFALGGLTAAFYYAYIMMQIPVGILVDRYGPKRLLVSSTFLCALSTILFALAKNIETAYLARFIMGFCAAFAFVGTLKLVSNWFPRRRFALVAGMTQALGMLGACVGDAPMALIFHAFGWRVSMMYLAGAFIGVALLILIFVKDKPSVPPDLTRSVEPAARASFEGLVDDLKHVLGKGQLWLNCLFIGLLYAPTSSFAGLWGVTYLRSLHHFSTDDSATAVGMVFIGLTVGCPIMGWLSGHFKTRIKTMRLSIVLSLILLCFITYTPELSLTEVTVLLFCYGLCNSGLIPSYTLSSELFEKRLAGTALGLTNMCSVLIGSLFMPAIGFVLQRLWDGTMVAGAPVYRAGDFQRAFLLYPVCFVIGLIVTFLIRETYHRHH